MATHSSILAWRIPMDRGAWRATAHRVTKNQTWLKEFKTHACTCTGSGHAGFGSYSTRAPECWLSNCGPRA